MSNNRWRNNFESGSYREDWQAILNLVETLEVNDASVTSDVEELARFVKVFKYLDELLNACDPDLIPLSIWSTFNQQVANCKQNVINFESNKNITYLRKANDHLDQGDRMS
ncbi:hypothetical protein AB4525_16600, partial [Vibrio breoganii]